MLCQKASEQCVFFICTVQSPIIFFKRELCPLYFVNYCFIFFILCELYTVYGGVSHGKENANRQRNGDCFLKKARTDQKLTYEEAAEISGISSRYLKAIENSGNVPSFEKIKQLVCALNVSPVPLFYKDNHTENLDYQRLQLYLAKCSDDQIIYHSGHR